MLVMAGLVPAIHVLQYLGMAGGYVYFMTNRPNGILYVGVTNDIVRRFSSTAPASSKASRSNMD
jgi:GIY-YIG catalytic domain